MISNMLSKESIEKDGLFTQMYMHLNKVFTMPEILYTQVPTDVLKILKLVETGLSNNLLSTMTNINGTDIRIIKDNKNDVFSYDLAFVNGKEQVLTCISDNLDEEEDLILYDIVRHWCNVYYKDIYDDTTLAYIFALAPLIITYNLVNNMASNNYNYFDDEFYNTISEEINFTGKELKEIIDKTSQYSVKELLDNYYIIPFLKEIVEQEEDKESK